MTPPRISDDPKAPFGYDEDAHVIAPFGLKADGTPRLSNRGRMPGQGFGAAKKKAAAPPKKTATKPGPAEKPAQDAKGRIDPGIVAGGILQLTSIPLSILGSDPGGMVSRFIGESQTMALQGDAAIIGMFAQPMGYALGQVASVNPWLAAKLEGGNMPKEYVVLAVTAGNLIAALAGNHRKPSEKLAKMGNQMAATQAMQLKAQIDALRGQAEDQAEDQEQEQPAPEDDPLCDCHDPAAPLSAHVPADQVPGYAPGPGQRDAYGTPPLEYQAAV